jgi:V8-like Glu-specific endopeptidase
MAQLSDIDSPNSSPLLGIKTSSVAKSVPALNLDSIQAAAGSDFIGPNTAKILSNVRAERPLRGARETQIYKMHSRAVVLVATKDGLGSGSLIDASGMVLTNWHVIKGYTTVAVIFKPIIEGKEPTKTDMRRGVVIRVDEVADLALIKVDSVPVGIAPIVLGQIADVAVGADVHAIGHPTGEAWTYTKGIVSQVRQNYEWTSETHKLHKAHVIQTQTPINPGNSGGPLITNDGKLVGVNSFKSKGEGLNFAVAVDDVRRFLFTQGGDRIAQEAPAPNRKAASGGCEPKELYRGTNADDTMEVAGIDLDCDGKADAETRVPYDVRKPMQLVVDANKDGYPDKIIFSKDRKKRWDYSLVDTDFDKKWDLVCEHETGELEPTRCEPYKPTTPK